MAYSNMTFNVSTGLAFVTFDFVQVSHDANNYIIGKVVSYNSGTGDLIIFPSHLTHMVQTKQGDGTRISISFNTFLKGYIGSDESLTGLHLGEE